MDHKYQSSAKTFTFAFVGIILLFFLCLLFSGCKTTKYISVPIETVKTEKEYIDKWQKDSIYIRDSVFLVHKGDTVFLEKYRYIYKDKIIRDSIYIRDSIKIEIPYTIEVVKEINRLKNWQIILMVLGGVFVGYIGFVVLRKVD